MKSLHDYRGEERAARKRWRRLSNRWNEPTKSPTWYGDVFALELKWQNKIVALHMAVSRRSLRGGMIRVYSGTRPINADTAPSNATILAELKLS